MNDIAVNDIAAKDIGSGNGGARCTFQITVCFQRNSTWQGSILWMERNETQNFRSVLELLILMDEAISEGAEDAEKPKWDM